VRLEEIRGIHLHAWEMSRMDNRLSDLAAARTLRFISFIDDDDEEIKKRTHGSGDGVTGNVE